MQRLNFYLSLAALAVAAVLPTPAFAAGVTGYHLTKFGNYEQTSNAAPLINTYAVELGLAIDEPTDATAATLTYSGPLSPLTLPLVAEGSFEFGSPYPTETAMDAAFPNGIGYTFTIQGGTLGSQSAVLELPAATIWPSSVPYLIGDGYDRLVHMDVTQELTLTRSSFVANPDANRSAVVIGVIDILAETQPFFRIEMDDFTQTSVTIPANTLRAGRDYEFTIQFSNIHTEDSNYFDGANAANTAFYTNDIRFRTPGVSAAAPEPTTCALLLPALAAFGLFRARRRKA